MNTFLARLGDGRSTEHGVVSTGALTALALVNPRTLTPGKRVLYRMTVAGMTAWTAWASFRATEEETPVPPEVRVGLTTAAGGVAMGIAEFGELLDGKMHDGLVKRGVKRPRLWLAAATAVLGGATWYLDRKTQDAPAHGATPEG